MNSSGIQPNLDKEMRTIQYPINHWNSFEGTKSLPEGAIYSGTSRDTLLRGFVVRRQSDENNSTDMGRATLSEGYFIAIKNPGEARDTKKKQPNQRGIIVKEKGMEHSIEITSIDDQILLLAQTEKNEIEEGREVDDLIEKDSHGQDPSGSQINKSINQIFDEMFEDLENSSIQSCTIFKVNVWIRESNPHAYTPKMVSIGPYHKKNPQLGPMEKYKLLYLQRFLQRRRGLDVKSCINELVELKEDALKCYDLDTDELEKLQKEALKCYDVKIDEFCQMLLLDGCFVVEFIRERRGIYPRGKGKIININNVRYIFRDLMLLENQLPFFVLNKLHDMTKRDDELPLEILVGFSFPFVVDLPEMTLKSFIETRGCDDIKHLLHLIHILSCHGNCKKKSTMGRKVIPNATELSEAGVRFKKVRVTTTLFDGIKFDKGLMKIPCFNVVDSTEIFLRNLIAYEQQSIDVHPKYFSDFAVFMDYLIESDKDVNLLRQEGIIVNQIGEDKGVTKLFNKIGNGVITYPDFYYKEECSKACQHCEKWWNRMKANLKHNYFSSPWVGASTVAAIILLILTTIQTVLAFTGSIK